MKGVKSAGGRMNGGPDRRPSYPGEQWIRQANTGTKIWVKVAMGIAYFFCVSIAAFVLAIYYVIFWRPDNSTSPATPPPMNSTFIINSSINSCPNDCRAPQICCVLLGVCGALCAFLLHWN